jgi:hypothetical protein
MSEYKQTILVQNGYKVYFTKSKDSDRDIIHRIDGPAMVSIDRSKPDMYFLFHYEVKYDQFLEATKNIPLYYWHMCECSHHLKGVGF